MEEANISQNSQTRKSIFFLVSLLFLALLITTISEQPQVNDSDAVAQAITLTGSVFCKVSDVELQPVANQAIQYAQTIPNQQNQTVSTNAQGRFQLATNVDVPAASNSTKINAINPTDPQQPNAVTGTQYYVATNGSDSNDGLTSLTPLATINTALNKAQPGDVVNLAAGTYLQDIKTVRNGSLNSYITIQGPRAAVVSGGGNSRIFEINHDYIWLKGFTIDGHWQPANQQASYRDKLIYMVGIQANNGVTGVRIDSMSLKNAGGECVRMKYFATNNEVMNNVIENCGVHDFVFNAGGKNGEAVYIGTAPEQISTNPTSDVDASSNNWVHQNIINTRGNECVDIKEGSSGNIIEDNDCQGSQDPNSAGFDSRGNGNIFRFNKSYNNLGAGVRLGGDTATDGINNDVYGNQIFSNQGYGVKIQTSPQGKICGNQVSGNSQGSTNDNNYPPNVNCPEISTTPTHTPTATPVVSPIPTSTPSITPSPVITPTTGNAPLLQFNLGVSTNQVHLAVNCSNLPGLIGECGNNNSLYQNIKVYNAANYAGFDFVFDTCQTGPTVTPTIPVTPSPTIVGQPTPTGNVTQTPVVTPTSSQGTQTPVPTNPNSSPTVTPTNISTTPTATRLPTPTITPTGANTLAQCKNMDANTDSKLDLIDFSSFAEEYQSHCQEKRTNIPACGSQDVNNDNKIDIIDFLSFAGRYLQNC